MDRRGGDLERAIAADPDFALAHIARARMHTLLSAGRLARQKAALARELVAKRGTERERSHVETLALAIEGQLPEAIAPTLKHIEAWPRDAMVMSLPMGAFGLFAFSGMADHDQARGRAVRTLRASLWRGLVVPHHYGWAMTENNDVSQGRAMTERGFALRRPMPTPRTRVLHAMFEDGSVEDADRLVDDWIPSYDRAGILHGHIRWHQALGALEHGDAARALTIYADVLQPRSHRRRRSTPSPTARRCCGACQAYGHTVPERSGSKRDTYAQRKAVSAVEPALRRCAHGAVRSCDAKPARRWRNGLPRSSSGSPMASCRPAPWCQRSSARMALLPDEDYAAASQCSRPFSARSCASAAAMPSASWSRTRLSSRSCAAVSCRAPMPCWMRACTAAPRLRDTRWQAATG